MATSIISTIPAALAADYTGFELSSMTRVAESLAHPMPAGDAALVAEAIRLHALGKTL